MSDYCSQDLKRNNKFLIYAFSLNKILKFLLKFISNLCSTLPNLSTTNINFIYVPLLLDILYSCMHLMSTQRGDILILMDFPFGYKMDIYWNWFSFSQSTKREKFIASEGISMSFSSFLRGIIFANWACEYCMWSGELAQKVLNFLII